MTAIESPRQMVGGLRDAAQSIIDLGEAIDELEIPFTDIPLSAGGVTFTDKQGRFSPDYHGPREWRRLMEGGEISEPDLPGVRPPSTIGGAAIRGITGFVHRFA